MNTFLPGEWKPILSALVQPPAGVLILLLVGVLLLRRRGWQLAWVGLCSALLWLLSCTVTAVWLQDRWLAPPPALSAQQIQKLRGEAGRVSTAIVVLGSGRHASTAEYAGEATLTARAMVRLRYGIWLSRQTGLPLGYSGGVGWAQDDGPSEAETAARIVKSDAGLRLRWVEGASRDTRENAQAAVALLQRDKVRRIVLVTHASHMPRSLRAFRQAAGGAIECMPAPVEFATREDRPVLDWLPSSDGFRSVHAIVHELIGLLAGA